MDNGLLKDGFVITLKPFISMKADHIIELPIESTLKALSSFGKKDPLQVAFFSSPYHEVFLNIYLKGVLSIVIF